MSQNKQKESFDINAKIAAHLESAIYARQYSSATEELQSTSIAIAIKHKLGINTESNKNEWDKEKTALELRHHFTFLTEDEALALAEQVLQCSACEIPENVRDEVCEVLEKEHIAKDVLSFQKQSLFIALPIVLLGLVYLGLKPFLYPAQWTATYYPNKELSGTPFGVFDEHWPDHNWGLQPAHPGLGANNFSVRFESILELDRDAEVLFNTVSDDGVRLYVNDKLVMNYWIPQDSISRTAKVPLTQGVHKIRLEYYEAENGARISFKAKAQGDATMLFFKE